MIKAIVFDVGETLVDETRQWRLWADWLGVPTFTFFAALGGVIARGEHHRKVFDLVAPGLDIEHAARAREQAGSGYVIEARDLYPDALTTLQALKAIGFTLGIAGNQPEAAEAALAACGVEVDFIASSARWGVEKPAPAFFERLAAEAQLAPGRILHVGDRLDNDIRPAKAAGLATAFLRRGPWALLQSRGADEDGADICLFSLAALPEAIVAWTAGRRA